MLAHVAVGATQRRRTEAPITGRSWLANGTEKSIVGVVEAAITVGLGTLLHAVGG